MNADGSGRTRIADSPGREESPDWQPMPLAGEYPAACADVVHAGAGAYSVRAAGVELSCTRARDIAAAWSASAATGELAGRVDGFTCATSDAGDVALLVECTHRGNRLDAAGEGNDRAIAWLWRGATTR